jgi:hypothetical protein
MPNTTRPLKHLPGLVPHADSALHNSLVSRARFALLSKRVVEATTLGAAEGRAGLR